MVSLISNTNNFYDTEGILRIPQSSSITEASPPNNLVSYTGHSLAESYPSTEMQSVYSVAPGDWAIHISKA